MSIDLHIFTNCHIFTPSTILVRDTYNSFLETFGDDFADTEEIKVWLDPNPIKKKYSEYRRNLSKNFSNLEVTNSLSDGYIKAVQNSTADHLFMLEGDWIFNTDLIKHSLSEIIAEMELNGIYHLRFNKRQNTEDGWDTGLTECKGNNFTYCKTPILSNNPHIINRKKYIEFIKKEFIKVKPGSHGIEGVISKQEETWGAIYGGLNYPATLTHCDGRKGKKIMPYDKNFYDRNLFFQKSLSEKITPFIIKTIKPTSIIDFGCGCGYFLKSLVDEGSVTDDNFKGLNFNKPDNLKIDEECFNQFNFSDSYVSEIKYDLVISLEVAEHLIEKSADIFVESLVFSANDYIIFSAATPGQGGEGYLNEQPHKYWHEKFASHGFKMTDPIRPILKNDKSIPSWYRNNIFLYKREI